MIKQFLLRVTTASLIAIFAFAGYATAELKVYTLDPAKSFLEVSGRFLIFDVAEQSPNSLLASISGEINADIGSSTIQFQSASLTPDSMRSFAPGNMGAVGIAPANYGGSLNLGPYGSGQVAFRDLIFTLSSPVLPKGTQIPSNSITLSTTMGSLDFNFGALGSGRDSFAPLDGANQATPATVVVANGFETITIPIDATFLYGADTMIKFEGELVGVRPSESSLSADFDGDGDVDGRDFLIWQQNVGQGTTHAQGDADFDGDVDGADLEIWKSQFGSSVPTLALSKAQLLVTARATRKIEQSLKAATNSRRVRPSFRPTR